MNFLDVHKKKIQAIKQESNLKPTKAVDIPDGVFVQCERCGAALYEKVLKSNASVCPVCQNHFRIGAQNRLEITVDQNSFQPLFDNVMSTNPLRMPGYENKIIQAQQFTQQQEAFISGVATIVGIPVAMGILDANFMMGSMGSVVGEKVARLVEHAMHAQLPLIIFTASGGARMQEGIFSLMQMAKTSGVLHKFDQKGGLFISVMTHPTTGGVAASFAALGDIIIAEMSSLIGFAGPRVIKQTIQQDLPEGFQTAEFQLEHGQVDMVVHRQDMKKTLYHLLSLHLGGIYESL
jgi:acetyl-CoA carboxylase carboxyl transferase subunit beta